MSKQVWVCPVLGCTKGMDGGPYQGPLGDLEKHIAMSRDFQHSTWREERGIPACPIPSEPGWRKQAQGIIMRVRIEGLAKEHAQRYHDREPPKTAVRKYWHVYHNLPESASQLEKAKEIQAAIEAVGGKSTGAAYDIIKHSQAMALTGGCPWAKTTQCPCLEYKECKRRPQILF